MTLVPQVELLQVGLRALAGEVSAKAVVARLIYHDVPHSFKIGEIEFLRNYADLFFGQRQLTINRVPKHFNTARGFLYQRTDDTDGGGFTGPVGA